MTTNAHDNGAGIGMMVVFIVGVIVGVIGTSLVHKAYMDDAIRAGVAYYAPDPDPLSYVGVFTWRTNEQFAIRR